MLATNLVAYYKLDESSGDVADSVGTVTLTNNGTTTFTGAFIQNGADYGTANSTKYFRTTNTFGMDNTSSCSFSSWIKMRTDLGVGAFCAFSDLIAGATNQQRIQLLYADSAGTKSVIMRRGNSIADKDVTTVLTLGTTNWYHLVITYDGTNVVGYINGVNKGSIASSGSGPIGQTSKYTIGASSDNTPNGFSSCFQDEVGVWTRAITDAEVTFLYSGGKGRAYPFVENSLPTLGVGV